MPAGVGLSFWRPAGHLKVTRAAWTNLTDLLSWPWPVVICLPKYPSKPFQVHCFSFATCKRGKTWQNMARLGTYLNGTHWEPITYGSAAHAKAKYINLNYFSISKSWGTHLPFLVHILGIFYFNGSTRIDSQKWKCNAIGNTPSEILHVKDMICPLVNILMHAISTYFIYVRSYRSYIQESYK